MSLEDVDANRDRLLALVGRDDATALAARALAGVLRGGADVLAAARLATAALARGSGLLAQLGALLGGRADTTNPVAARRALLLLDRLGLGRRGLLRDGLGGGLLCSGLRGRSLLSGRLGGDLLGDSLVGRLLTYDSLEQSFRTLRLRRDPGCPACGDETRPPRLVEYDDACRSAGTVARA